MVTLWLCGDVMIGRGIDQVMQRSADPRLFESAIHDAEGYVRLAEAANGPIPRPVGPDYVWGDALADMALARPDACVANLETALTTSDAGWPGKEVLYRAHPSNVAVLRAAGIDCCTLANNHALDWGTPGLLETLDTMRMAGMATAGAGRTPAEAEAPAFVATPGARVVVVAFASTNSGVPRAWAARDDRPGLRLIDGWSELIADGIAAQLRPVRQPGDVVIASVHWGSNWGHEIPAAQVRLAHRLVDAAGVDVVHGHSSHHARGVELYRGRPILYGCGDIITDYEGITGYEAFRNDLVAAYLVTIPSPGELGEVRILPYRLRRFRLERASARDAAWLTETLDRHSRPLGTSIEPDPDGTLRVTPG